MNWFYSDGGAQKGPIDDAAFRALVTNGTIRPDTLVWHDGMTDWKPLSAAEKLVKKAEDEIKRTGDEGSAAAQKRIVASLEREIRAALEERRVEDAEFLLKNLLMLVPEHKFKK